MNQVPSWLSFDWWWLLLVSLLLVLTQFVMHLRLSSPALLLLAWSIVQADWMKRANRQSRGIYWISAAGALYVAYLAFVLTKGPLALGSGATLLLYFVTYIVGMLALCKDFERLFEQSGSTAVDMTSLMAVFFGAYYFQFHLHALAVSQRATGSEP